MYRRLSGLEEKCRIYNNDDVADALHARVQRLSSHANKWVPELLSLLLSLSDNPLTSSIEELDQLKREVSPPPLTWTEILRDDPLEDSGGIWNTTDYGEDSFDDSDGLSVASYPLQATSTYEFSTTSSEHSQHLPLARSTEPDYDLLDEIKQFHSKLEDSVSENYEDDREPVPEIQLVKETLFMLHGLPTRIFGETDAGSIYIRYSVRIQNVSKATTEHALDILTGIGTKLNILRRFADSREHVPLLQSFQASILARLEKVGTELSSIESHILESSGPSVTLLGVLSRVQDVTRFILPLADILLSLEPKKNKKYFEVLELLYDKVCLSQSVGDGAYPYLAEVFFECLQAFMKPIRKWMEAGEIESDDEIFFVKRNQSVRNKVSLWSEQFELLQNEDGTLYAPRFLHLAAKKILTSGKSVNMLRALGQNQPSIWAKDEIMLSFDSVCRNLEDDRLSPFPELFAEVFEAWISSKYRLSSYRLSEALISHCGLWTALDAMELIYFARNGSLQLQFARSVFDKFDRGKHWNDDWVMTSLLQDTFQRIDVIDPAMLSVKILENPMSQHSPRSIHQLDSIILIYTLPWAVGTIIQTNSLSTYQRIFTLLIQTQRAKLLLDSQIMEKSHIGPTYTLILYLRHRLRWYVETLHSHLTTMLSGSTQTMRCKLEEAEDLDAMIAVHKSYVQKLMYRSLLTEEQASTNQAMISLLDLVIVFSDTCNAVKKAMLNRVPTPIGRHHEPEASSSEEGDDDDESADLDTEGPESGHNVLLEKLSGLSSTYSRLLDFVVAGVRDASRIGDTYLDILVDNLSFGVRW